MKVLVTGAAGFIGAPVVRQLLATGHQPYALIRPATPSPRLDDIRDRLEIVEVDLADGPRTDRVVRGIRPDAVIHLAWYAQPGRYRHALVENVASVQASLNLLLAASASGCARVVLGGTCLENAAAVRGPIYEAAKAAVHRLSDGFAETGMSVACGHVFYLYGPGEDERRVIPSVIRALLSADPIATSDGLQGRDYLHVTDVASAFCVLADSSLAGGIDICSGTLVTLADVMRLIAEQTGRSDLLRLGELGPAADDSFSEPGDPNPLLSVGWRPRYDIRAGIDDTIAWWNARLEGRS